MAKRRTRGRPIDGLLLLDKPQGLTSNHALQIVKGLYFAQKAGHTGSLDPLATGMLPLCFGEATKLSQFLLDADKHYRVTAKLGVKTTTADADGEIIEQRPVTVTQEQILKALEAFRGDIQQIPSMYSALKYQGKPLYKLARQGIEIEREPRSLTIHQLSVLDFSGDQLQLEVVCSKGTYVRNLVEDIGEVLGCGAHVMVLRRINAGHLPEDRLVTMEQLEQLRQAEKFIELDQLLLPIDMMVDHLPAVELTPVAGFQIRQGNPVQVKNSPSDGLARLYLADKEQFIGVGEINEQGLVAPKRLLKF